MLEDRALSGFTLGRAPTGGTRVGIEGDVSDGIAVAGFFAESQGGDVATYLAISIASITEDGITPDGVADTRAERGLDG